MNPGGNAGVSYFCPPQFRILRMQKRWKLKPAPDAFMVQSLAKALNINTVLAGLLVQRGIDDYDKAYTFFRPKLEYLHDPFGMKDMDKAVRRILQALQNGESILIYGDYDVDGTTAVAMLFSFFRDELHYPNIAFYIPDRYSEGYGISFTGIDFAADNDFSLVIALDCGIKAIEHMQYAKEKHIDFIICDHHLPGDEIPEAAAVLNPKQAACTYPFKELCGCGVGFKLLQAISSKLAIPRERLFRYLDLVAVSTCSDIVPLNGENRILVHYGLKQLNAAPRPGLQRLIEITGVKREFTVEDVVFMIGPRINAAGRIKHGNGAVDLLIAAPGDPLLEEMCRALDEHNLERRGLDRSITKEAIRLVEENELYHVRKSTVIYEPAWHKGVIGIVASRLVERFYKPAIVLTQSNGKASGSARSVKGFDVHQAIEQCRDLLENYGGHMHAAGLTMKLENVPLFIRRFDEIVEATILPELLVPEVEIDATIELAQLTPKFYQLLRQFAPFGPGNMNPVFTSTEMNCGQGTRIVGDNHLKLDVYCAGRPENCFAAIGFNLGRHFDAAIAGKPFSAAFTVGENTWNDKTTLQLDLKDLQFEK
jgi:single-stranded-DNA-specific exonuclease